MSRSKEDAAELAAQYQRLFPAPENPKTSAGERLVARMDALHSGANYAIAGASAWIPAAIGLVVTGAWCVDQVQAGDELETIPLTVVMAFVGGYVWSLYELIRSGQRGDLTPSRLFALTFRILASVPVGYAFSLIVVEEAMAFVAFVASAFPIRDLRLFLRAQFLKRLDSQAPAATSMVSCARSS